MSTCLTFTHLLFADDLVFYVDCEDYEKGLIEINNCYQSLKAWCIENCLKLNERKIKIMLFHKANDYRAKCIPDSVILGNGNLKVVECSKYKGANIDSTLSFSKHYEVVNSRMNDAISKL